MLYIIQIMRPTKHGSISCDILENTQDNIRKICLKYAKSVVS